MITCVTFMFLSFSQDFSIVLFCCWFGQLFASISGILIIYQSDPPGVLLFSLYLLEWVFCGVFYFSSLCFIAKEISPILPSFIFPPSKNSFLSLIAFFTSMLVFFYGCIKFSGLFKDFNNRFFNVFFYSLNYLSFQKPSP